ncbi:MAG TPA: ABC transporter substrate-binding protein [Nitrospirota bacterium]|nr:ABC transporter substrate-binding protein [Nitrospirota bacterium]
MNRFILFSILAAIMLLPAASSAEVGVTDKEIKVGMSTALSGATGFLGTSFRSGIASYISQVNASGGVNGRKIRLIVYDDQYEPENTTVLVRKLIFEDKVFCLLGNLGTATTAAILPLLEENKVPLFAPFSGADSLRQPVKRYLLHYRPSYSQEIEVLIKGVVDVLGFKKVAVFYQDDGFGKAVLEGTELALERRGLSPVATGTYTRNFEDITSAMETIMAAKPHVVVVGGVYSASAKFIRSWKSKAVHKGSPKDLDPVFLNLSVVGPDRFAKLLDSYGYGVVVTQVVPPFSSGGQNLAAVNEYLSAVGASEGAANYGGLEGYLTSKVFVHILTLAGKNLTRETFVETAESIRNLDIQAGNSISFSPSNHQGSQTVYPTVLMNSEFAPITDWHLIRTP